jgi:hypothetical protein
VGEDVQVTGSRVLRQVADAAGTGHLTAGRLGLSGQAPRQGGLAGTVAPDQPDPVAGRDPEGAGTQQQAGAGSQLQPGGGDQWGSFGVVRSG